MVGAELGYRYQDSPIVWPEEGEAPAPDFVEYRPTTFPGARLPHVWLQDGSAVQDRIGYELGFTLLRFSNEDSSGLESVRHARRTFSDPGPARPATLLARENSGDNPA